jgi:hypothetical protein
MYFRFAKKHAESVHVNTHSIYINKYEDPFSCRKIDVCAYELITIACTCFVEHPGCTTACKKKPEQNESGCSFIHQYYISQNRTHTPFHT